MNAVSIGPLLFSAERFSALIGIAAFWLAAAIAGRRLDRGLTVWSGRALVAGLIGARLGHVAAHVSSFAEDPLRILYVWQGGFSLAGGLAGVALVAALLIRSVKAFAGAAGSVAAGLAVWGFVSLLTLASTGTPLPSAALARLDGRPAALTELVGKPMVINLWATWCPPCRRELPLLVESAAANPDIHFAFVNQGDGAADISSYLDEQGLHLNESFVDPSWSTATHYGAKGLPTTLFVDTGGHVVDTHVGEISPEQLDEQLDRLTGR